MATSSWKNDVTFFFFKFHADMLRCFIKLYAISYKWKHWMIYVLIPLDQIDSTKQKGIFWHILWWGTASPPKMWAQEKTPIILLIHTVWSVFTVHCMDSHGPKVSSSRQQAKTLTRLCVSAVWSLLDAHANLTQITEVGGCAGWSESVYQLGWRLLFTWCSTKILSH